MLEDYSSLFVLPKHQTRKSL